MTGLIKEDINISNITSIKLVEYDYGIKQLGLKNEDLLQDTDA